jgi:hypothetical protein
MPAVPTIAWPDQDADPARPFLEFRHFPVLVSDTDIAGGGEVWRGQVLINVVAARGDLAKAARTIAEQVRARFAFPLRLPVTGGGTVLVRKPPEVRAGIPDGADWRLPVVIDYITE